MEANVNTTLNSREMAMVDILWKLYSLQNEKVKRAFLLRVKKEVAMQKDSSDEQQTTIEE